MPSRSRHSRNRNNHSNRSSNKSRNRPDTQSQSQSKSSESKSPNITSNTHKSRSKTPPHDPIDDKDETMESIQEFEEEILYELNDDALSISELSLLLEEYLHRRNASALFLLRIISKWSSGERTENITKNNLLHHSESCDKMRNTLFKVLFGLTDKITFKNVLNQIAFALSVIKILSSGLPTVCVTLMQWLAKHVQSPHSSSSNLEKDQLRFIVMFLRPEIIEQCAELVSFNASIFEVVFRELITALCDSYQPFRIWLFARLCSKQRGLVEAPLAKFICFGDISSKKKIAKEMFNNKRRKSWIISDNDDDANESDEMNLNRLLSGFKYCICVSNELVINNESLRYYELGHLILNEVICIASILRYHFFDEYRVLIDGYLSIMHCNLGSIYLHCNRYRSALSSASCALSYDINCIQCHRIIAEYYMSYAADINYGFSCLYSILSVDSDHPYAINRAKEVVNDIGIDIDCSAYICTEIGNCSRPCARHKHSAVAYRGDRLIIYGGCSVDNVLNDLWILDINANRWMRIDTVGVIPWKRHSHCADIVQHKLYIIGGASDDVVNDELVQKKRVFSITYSSDEEEEDKSGGYALGGWFTNFFNKNDHNKIKELATKGIVDDSAYYDNTRCPALFLLDLKHNKWIKPCTTGSGPSSMLINHDTVCVAQSIFVFSFSSGVYFVLDTSTLHWSSFLIPSYLCSDNYIATLYGADKILFVTPFGCNGYYKHCLLFTCSMEWSPIRLRPSYNNGLNVSSFAVTQFKHYMVIHGGINDSYIGQESMNISSDLLCIKDDLLSPLYRIQNIDNVDSRVSVVESLLFNKNATDIHRIGPIKKKQQKRVTTTSIITACATTKSITQRTKTITTTFDDDDDDKKEIKHIELSSLEIFDFISMRWIPRIALHEISSNIKYNNNDDLNILNTPRINHSITIVGNNLCIFGGIKSNQNVLMIHNFINTINTINDKYYKQQTKYNYDETNALSLSKYLEGIYQNNIMRMVQCANCAILECIRFNFRTCSGCAKVQYCSKLCQKNHWKQHHRHFCQKNHIRYQ